MGPLSPSLRCLYVRMFLLFNHRINRNQTLKGGSLVVSPRPAVLTSSQNSPSCLVTGVTGSIARVLVGSIPALGSSKFNIFCLPSLFG